MVDFSDLLNVAKRAAVEAGQEIMTIYQTDFEVDYKTDASPLTLADSTANEIIMQHLKTLDIPIISEENKTIAYAERKDRTQFWLVDPLDGTKEFIKKNDEFTVNIALIQEGIPVLGVIYVPVKNELYYNDKESAYKLLNIKTSQDLNKAKSIELEPKSFSQEVVVVASRSHLSQETSDFIERIKSCDGIKEIKTFSAGSSLKLCMIAEGKADVYPRFAPTMEWDIAAGHAICRANGVAVLQTDLQTELQYNKPNLLNPYFIVGSQGFIQNFNS
ncbi:MAG: 3'(2'),5'-bisphosphate nucleotidase CysQ [Weeksellaceae bacterium]